MDAAQRLLCRLWSFEPVLRDFLLSERISASIQGFFVTDFPLWKFAYLLDETWIEEDIMNALAELAYFVHAISSQDDVPMSLYLPTNFISDARRLYHQHPRVYSPELLALRNRLTSTRVECIAFLECTNYHYSAFILNRSQLALLKHSDSLGHLASDDILPILRWILSGTNYPLPIHIHEIDAPRQAASGTGSGSCGIAAHDFVLRHLAVDSSSNLCPQWTSLESPRFRDDALLDLVEYHYLVSKTAIVSFSASTYLGLKLITDRKI